MAKRPKRNRFVSKPQVGGQSGAAVYRPLWARHWVLCSALVFITFSLYTQIAGHPFINYDDEGYVTANPHVREGLSWHTFVWSISAIEQANWHPVTWLSHALDCQLFGLAPAGHHLSSLLIHAINVLLLFLLLRRATGEQLLSFLVAALFAVHPFNVESVAWVSERKNVLSTVFFLLTLAAYGWYAQKRNTKRYFLVIATFVLGLASKPMLVTLPAVLLLMDYWPLQGIEKRTPLSTTLSIPQKNLSHLIWEKIPLLFFSIASSVITLIAQKTGEALAPFSIAVRLKTALAGYALYILKTFWPSSFALYYPDPFDPYLNQHPSPGDYLLVAAGAGLLILISLAAWRYRRERPYVLVGWFWYVGTLLPVIGVVKAGPQMIADRYAYIPLIGIFVAVVWGLSEFARAHRIHARWRLSASISVLTTLFIISFLQVRYWRSSFDIFFHTLSVTKNNLVANEKVAVLLLQQGNADDALHYYFEAARIAPLDPTSHEAVAAELDEQGRYQEALQAYDIVIRNSKDPAALALAYSNLGVIHSRMRNFTQARADAQKAVRIDPTRVDAQISGLARFYSQNPSLNGYIKLSLLLDNTGRVMEARAACKKAAEIDPTSVEVRKILEHLDSE